MKKTVLFLSLFLSLYTPGGAADYAGGADMNAICADITAGLAAQYAAAGQDRNDTENAGQNESGAEKTNNSSN